MSPEDEAALREAQRQVEEATRDLARLGVSGASPEVIRDARDRLSRAEVALRLAGGSRGRRKPSSGTRS